MYRSIVGDENRYLMTTELPAEVTIRGVKYSVTVLDTFAGVLGAQQQNVSSGLLTLYEAVRQTFASSNSGLITVGPANGAFTSAIREDGTGFICFDSHSRTATGLATTGGKAVVLRVQSALELTDYILELAKSLFGYERFKCMPFELSPIICSACSASQQSPVVKRARNDDVITISSNTSTGTTRCVGLICDDETTKRVDDNNENCSSEANLKKFNSPAKGSKDLGSLVPNVLQREVYDSWKQNRSWISAQRINEKEVGLICTSCKEVGSLSHCIPFSKERLKIADEWLHGINAKSRKALHDKMTQHERSKAHIMCQQLLQNRSAQKIERAVDKSSTVWEQQNARRIEQTCRSFRTAYMVAWKQVSFRMMPHLVSLQQKNGLQMGNMLFSDHSCHNIICFVAKSMRQRLVAFILKSDAPFSLLFDESTTMGNQTALILYIRALDPTGTL